MKSLPPSLLCLLLANASFAQLPPAPVPPQNPTTPAKVVLGKILFWDEQLSSDDSIACGTCHVPEFGGADPRGGSRRHPGKDRLLATADDVFGSPGLARQAQTGDFTPSPLFHLRPQVTPRLASTTLAAGHHDNLFWDSRASTQFTDPETNQVLIPYGGALESQALGPILNPVEMATEGRTWQDVRQKLQASRPLALATGLTPDITAALQQNPTYPLLFAAAFGDPAITAARIAFAIASYERTQNPDDTPWDRYAAGNLAALSAAELAGLALFDGSGRCNACHIAPTFQDDQSHVLGLRPAGEDLGLGGITQMPFDDGAFKTPTLRNAGLRPRLFHNGQSAALGDPSQLTDPASAHNVYLNGGGVDRSNLDPFLLVLSQHGVTPADMTLMLDFVRTALTDPRAAQGLPPFDHPQLRSMAVPPPTVFGASQAGASEPFLVDTVPTFLGNGGWKLGVAAGDGAGLSFLGYGLAAMAPGLQLGSMPWNVDVLDGRLLPLAGAPGAAGYATWRLPIPNDGNLLQFEFCFQLWALDAQAPVGISTSRGWRFVVQ